VSGGRFPQRVKRGSCVVTIYKTPTKGYDAFTVVHYNNTGARCRRMFTSYAQALKKRPKAQRQNSPLANPKCTS